MVPSIHLDVEGSLEATASHAHEWGVIDNDVVFKVPVVQSPPLGKQNDGLVAMPHEIPPSLSKGMCVTQLG